MSGFKQRDGEHAILVSGGVHEQVDVYEREGMVYAKWGSGFIQLYVDGSSTKSNVRCEHLSCEAQMSASPTGRLVLAASYLGKMRDLKLDQLRKLGLPSTMGGDTKVPRLAEGHAGAS